ncbi:MAG: TlpA disulfide reductase family protein [Terracidiphilus sp.]
MNPIHEAKSMLSACLNPFRPVALIMIVCLVLITPSIQSPGQANGGVNSQAAQSQAQYMPVPVQARQHAPDLSVADIAGNKITLSQYRGKAVLLDFWAVDCGGCVIEIPWYVQFDKKYHDNGLQLIGLDMYGESPNYIRPFMQKSQMNYPVAVGNDDIRTRFQAEELPKTILIDRRGRMAVAHVGIVDRDAFARDVEELLKEQ